MLDLPITIPVMEVAVLGFVLFVVQFMKQYKPFQGERIKRLLPAISGLLGAPAAVIYQWLFVGLIATPENITQLAIYGFTLGLTACGTFSFAKGLFMGKTKPKADDYSEKGDF